MSSSAHRRIHPALALALWGLSIFALVASAAGVGHAAANIGAAQLKNGAVTAAKIKRNAVTTRTMNRAAVTSAKVRDGSLTAADLVREERERPAHLSDGGEGDCVWGSYSAAAGLALPHFRKDRFGTVWLSGLAAVSDGPGGDGVCDPFAAGESEDLIAFALPEGYRPARTQFFPGGAFVVGPAGLTMGSLTFPPGVVVGGAGTASDIPMVLDGIAFEPVGSPVVGAPLETPPSVAKPLDPRALLGVR